jgi:hypothetical protein
MSWTTSTQINLKLTKIGPSFINKYSNNISSTLKERNKKAYKMNKNMVNIISNFNFAMCHVFIRDQLQKKLLINMFKSSSNDLALLKSQDTNED